HHGHIGRTPRRHRLVALPHVVPGILVGFGGIVPCGETAVHDCCPINSALKSLCGGAGRMILTASPRAPNASAALSAAILPEASPSAPITIALVTSAKVICGIIDVPAATHTDRPSACARVS